jgi:hypothetical protein
MHLISPSIVKRARPKVLVLLVLLGGWTFLWKVPWQPWLTAWPWLRLIVAVLMFSLPGICLQHAVYKGVAASVSRPLTLGFAISVGVTGLLGLLASLGHFSFGFVGGGLFVAGAVGLLMLVIGGVSLPKKRLELTAQMWSLAEVLPVLVAIVLAGRLCWATQIHGDDFTYNAYITHFEHSKGLGFNDIFFDLDRRAITRFWLAFWPLTEAVIAHNSQLHGLELTSIYLGPALAALSLLAVFELSRSVGLSRPSAYVALVAQFASLLLLTYKDQAGTVFFNRLTQDKLVAAFVLAPILFRLVVDFLRGPKWQCLGLLILVGLGLALTHPVILGIACLISAFYALLDLTAFRKVNAAAVLLCALLAIVTLPFALRFADVWSQRIAYKIEDASFDAREASRLEILEDNRFYGVNGGLVRGMPFGVVVAAGFVALLQWRRNPASRYVIASLLVVGSAAVPYTGWLLGLAITPAMLWRVPWLTPFGVGAALLVASAINFLMHKVPQIGRQKTRVTRIVTLSAQLILLMLVGVAYVRPVPARKYLESLAPQEAWAWPRGYDDLTSIGRQLDALIPERAVVVGGDQRTNDFIPSLSTKAEMVVFRHERYTRSLGSFSEEEAANRWDAWSKMVGPDTPAVERMSALMDYQVEFILLREDPPWMQSLVSRFPQRFELVSKSGELHLYQIIPSNSEYSIPLVLDRW